MEKVKPTLNATLFMVNGKLGWIFELPSPVLILVTLDGLIWTYPISSNLLILTLFLDADFSTSLGAMAVDFIILWAHLYW
jgi:hypothetical protein